MEALRVFTKTYVIFMCVTGYIFGQIFFGDISLDATIIGIGGITASIMWNSNNLKLHKNTIIIILITLLVLISCIYEAYYYYNYLNIPGNNFAWPMRAPLYAMFVLILINSILHLKNSKAKKNDKE